jgi:hypothetical protein
MQNLGIYLEIKNIINIKLLLNIKIFYIEVTFFPRLFFAQLIKNDLGICLYVNKN